MSQKREGYTPAHAKALFYLVILGAYCMLVFPSVNAVKWVEIGRWAGGAGYTGTGYFRTTQPVWRVKWSLTLSSNAEFLSEIYEDGEEESFFFSYRYGPTKETDNIDEFTENTADRLPNIHDSIGVFHIDVLIYGEGSYSLIVEQQVVSIPTVISCSVSSFQLTIVDYITISGSISPSVSGKTVTLTYMKPDGSTFMKTATTGADGLYRDSFKPTDLGSWSVQATWDGDPMYEGASSSRVSFTVSKVPSTVSCSPSSSSLTIGDSVTISGSIIPARAGVPVDINYRSDSSWSTLTNVLTASDGSFSYSWTPTSVGSYQLKASWEGDAVHEGASSPVVYLTVKKTQTSIWIKSSQSKINKGEVVMVSGTITPAVSGKTVLLTYTKPDGTAFSRTVTTAPDGSYSDSYKPIEIGIWKAKASWGGDAEHEGASSLLLSFSVEKISTTISASLSKTTITEGDEITVSGTIQPAPGSVSVTLTYTKPDGATMTRTVMSTDDGTYIDTFKPTPKGSWSVMANWKGSETHESATSQPASFTVEEKRLCIIATATYGTELSPEVQFLRGFRDNYVLNTFAGCSFMTVFNAWYYSFSPTVASIIAGNNLLRGFMRIILYPLIGILHLAATSGSLFIFNPELAVVVSGLVASLLIGIVYFTPFLLIPCLIKKVKITARVLNMLSLVWVLSVGFITAAEVTKRPDLMMFSTAIFVLATVSLVTLYTARYVTRIFYAYVFSS